MQLPGTQCIPTNVINLSVCKLDIKWHKRQANDIYFLNYILFIANKSNNKISLYRYIKYQNTGNQFVGYALSGLPILLKDLAVCFPYFGFSTCEDEFEKDRHKFTIYAQNCKQLPSGAQENEGIFYLMNCLVAFLVYHKKLIENLDARSELRCNVFL